MSKPNSEFQNEEEKLLLLVKFGEESHINSLMEAGEIYCNSIEYFKQTELNDARKDRWEGASRILQPSKLKSVSIDQQEILPYLRGPILCSNTEPAQVPVTHVFCAVGLTTSHITNQDKIVDDRVSEFGDTFAVIGNVKTFINQMKRHINLLGGEHFCWSAVEYVSDEFHGEYGPFKKRQMFKWQQEIRFTFYLPSRSKIPVKLSLGSMSNAAVKSKISKFENRIEIDQEGNCSIRF